MQRPWLPWTLCLLLAIGGTAFTAKAIVDRDEAARAVDDAQQQIERARREVERQEGLIEDSEKGRRDVVAARSNCLKASDLVIEFLRGLERVLEQARAGRLTATLIALDDAGDVREDLLPELRSCRRETEEVT
jgi:hypothetical protein